ncbi:MAG: CoA ester lyase [Pseudoclavibacter sp.]|nr:CoA ester lyase [Pseudoclavibacter sp.]
MSGAREDRARAGRPVPAADARSWLLVSAADPDRFEAAAASGADALVLDLEDAVDPGRKERARAGVLAWLGSGGRAWVRINDRASGFWAADVGELREAPGLSGVVLAKTEAPGHVEDTAAALGAGIPVVALVESARGLQEAPRIARSGAFRLAFGSGDFRRDTGMGSSREAMAYARSRLTVASRAAGLPGPVDGPTTDESLRVLREQAEWTVEFGMTGKLCLWPQQVRVVNEVIRPQGSDIEWALHFLADFEAAGGTVRDGSDPPRLGRARKILRLARAFGLVEDAPGA